MSLENLYKRIFCVLLIGCSDKDKLDDGGENMLIKIGDFEFTEVWDGVLYKKLSEYPKVSDWEIRNLIESS